MASAPNGFGAAAPEGAPSPRGASDLDVSSRQAGIPPANSAAGASAPAVLFGRAVLLPALWCACGNQFVPARLGSATCPRCDLRALRSKGLRDLHARRERDRWRAERHTTREEG